MTNTYNDVYTKANSKDCSVQEFRDILWQYVEDEMIKILKSGNVDIKLIKTLVNYSGNRRSCYAAGYGAHQELV